MGLFSRKPAAIPDASQALPGRREPIATAETHFVTGRPLAEVPAGFETVFVGMGCFWGAERLFWSLPGVWTTAVGYLGGHTPNPTYQEVCSGQTGHNEVVRLVFDPGKITLSRLLQVFWEGHDPTQGMRQGNDRGTQYRSGLYLEDEAALGAAETSKTTYGGHLHRAGLGGITTEILRAGPFYFAEDYHQQYLAKNPQGYCGIGGTGVSCPIGVQA